MTVSCTCRFNIANDIKGCTVLVVLCAMLDLRRIHGSTLVTAQKNSIMVSANFAMLIRRCRIRYKVSVLAVPCSIHLSRCIHANPSAPCPRERRNVAAYLEHQRSTLGLLVTTVPLLALRPIFPRSERTQVRSACIASTPTVPSSCTTCTPISTRPSSLSWPSCGKRVLSDHHNRIVCDHIDAFLGQTGMPGTY